MKIIENVVFVATNVVKNDTYSKLTHFSLNLVRYIAYRRCTKSGLEAVYRLSEKNLVRTPIRVNMLQFRQEFATLYLIVKLTPLLGVRIVSLRRRHKEVNLVPVTKTPKNTADTTWIKLIQLRPVH